MPVLLAPFLISGLVFFGALVLIALAHTFNGWWGSSSAAGNSGGLSWAFLNPLTAAVKLIGLVAGKVARTTVSHWALAHVKPVARFFGALAYLAGWQAREQAAVSETTARGFERLRSVVIPREIDKRALPAAKAAKAAQRTASTAVAREYALSATVTRNQHAQARLNVHYTHAVDVALPRTISGVRTREEALSRDQAKLRQRTTSLENGAIGTFRWLRAHPLSGVTGVFAGAVAVALGRLGWNVFRCRAWQGLGRKLTCGMGNWLAGLIDAIAVYALAGLAVLDPEALAEAAVAAVDVVEPILQDMLP